MIEPVTLSELSDSIYCISHLDHLKIDIKIGLRLILD